MGPFIVAWLVGEGIIVYRSVKKQKAPPGPGQLLLSSGVFVMLGILAEATTVRPLAVTLAWGFNAAALLNLFPQAEAGATNQGEGKWPPPLAPNNVIVPTGKK